MPTLRYIKHSAGLVRKPCAHCKTLELYWGHEQTVQVASSGDEFWCERCQASGPLILLDAATLRPHSCLGPPAVSDEKDPGNAPRAVKTPQAEKVSPQADNGEDEDIADELDQLLSETKRLPVHGDDPEMTPGLDGGEDAESGLQDGDELLFPDDDEYVTHRELNDLDLLTRAEAAEAFSNARESMMEIGRATVENELRTAALTKAFARIEKSQAPLLTLVVNNAATGEEYEFNELSHRQLPDLIMGLDSGESIAMVGAAGCGKGKMARQAAKALGLRFLSLPGSLNPQSQVSAIIGYMNSAGKYVRTTFRDAFEHGGLIFLDEFDRAHESCIAAVNDALAVEAGETVGFPDAMVARHPRFLVVAACNTYGRGPDRTYTAARRGDAATWDRFSLLPMEYDHALEDVLCRRIGLPDKATAEVVRYVRGLRANAKNHDLPHVIGMRASVGMCRLIRKGMDPDLAIEMRCRRGMSEQDWLKVVGDVRKPGSGIPSWNTPRVPDRLPDLIVDIAERSATDAIAALCRQYPEMKMVEAKTMIEAALKARRAASAPVG